jgi:hypothetical protein
MKSRWDSSALRRRKRQNFVENSHANLDSLLLLLFTCKYPCTTPSSSLHNEDCKMWWKRRKMWNMFGEFWTRLEWLINRQRRWTSWFIHNRAIVVDISDKSSSSESFLWRLVQWFESTGWMAPILVQFNRLLTNNFVRPRSKSPRAIVKAEPCCVNRKVIDIGLQFIHNSVSSVMTGNEFEFEHVDFVCLSMHGNNTALTRSIDWVFSDVSCRNSWTDSELSAMMDGKHFAGQKSSEFSSFHSPNSRWLKLISRFNHAHFNGFTKIRRTRGS